MFNLKFMIISVLLLVSSYGEASDFDPPSYRGDPLSTRQSWTRASPFDSIIEQSGLRSQGADQGDFNYDPLSPVTVSENLVVDTYEYEFEIPNFINLNPMPPAVSKLMRIQLTGFIDFSLEEPLGGMTVKGFNLDSFTLVNQTMLSSTQAVLDWRWDGAAPFKETVSFGLTAVTGLPILQHIVIDTVLVTTPEPGTYAIFALLMVVGALIPKKRSTNP